MGLNEMKARWASQRAPQRSERTPCSEEHDQICRYVKQPHILQSIADAVLEKPGEVTHIVTESRISEHCGRFNRFIGFADITFNAGGYAFIVEVKSGRVVVGEVLRQLKNYEAAVQTTHSTYIALVLVAAHLEPEQVEHLRAEGVIPIVLGTKYLEWKAPTGAPALEI